MEEARILQILGIDSVSDEEKIRDAYREKLTQVHPEENPEGFMELRRAYEEACRLAQKAVEEDAEKEEDNTPSGQWIARVAQIYGKLPERIDTARWKELFAEPILVDLEQEEACNEKLLVFLMDHFRLPAAVWRLVDDRLHIVQDRERLYEKFPKDFVDFCVAHCKQQGDDMAYGLFEGEADAAYDLFIRNYFDVLSAQEAGKTEESRRILEQADMLHIYHPHLELARAVQMEREGKTQAAVELSEKLLEKYPEDETVTYQTAELFFRLGLREKWVPLYQSMKEKNGRHYMANYRLTSHYLETEEYEKAKKCAEEVMQNPVSDEFQKVVQAINQKLEEKMERELEEEPSDFEKRLELGWCYLQDDKQERVFQLLDGFVPEAKKEREFESLLAKAAFSRQDYQTAKEHLAKWLPLLEKQISLEDGEEKQEDLGRIGTAHWMLSRILRETAKRENGEKAAEEVQSSEQAQNMDSTQSSESRQNTDANANLNPGQEPAGSLEGAMAELELAIEADSRSYVNYQYEKAQLLHEMKRDAECVDLCGALLAEYRFWPAYIVQQEAYESLRDAGGVIECYRNLVSIYPAYAENYEKAAEVYWELDRLDDMKSVLDEAAENKAASAKLGLLRCKQLRAQADSRKQMEEALQFAKGLEEAFKKNESKAVIAELFAECCSCEQRLGSLNDALDHIGKAIALDPDRLQYRMTRAAVLTDGGKAQEALSIYKEFETYYTNSAYFYCHLGDCYAKLDEADEALAAYERSVELAADQPYVYEQLVRICNRKIRSTWDLSWYERGKDYARRLIECNEIDYNYWLRGLMAMSACDYEQAEQDLKKAVEMDENDWTYYNDLGCVYQYTQRDEDAERCYLKASELADLKENPLSLRNLGGTYERQGRLKEAFDCYERLRVIYEMLPEKKEERNKIYRDLSNVLGEMGEYEKAVEYSAKSKDGDIAAAYEEEFRMAVEAGRYARAEQLLKLIAANKKNYFSKKKQDVAVELQLLIDRGWLHYTQGQLQQALDCYRQALACGAEEMSNNTDKFSVLCDRAGYCCFCLGLLQEEREWGLRALRYLEKQEGGIEKRERNLYSRLSALFDLAAANVHAGEMEKAKAYLETMKGLYKCRGCSYRICTDRKELEGLIAEKEGDTEKARALYGEVLTCTSTDADVTMKAARLSGNPAGDREGRGTGRKSGNRKGWLFRKRKQD